MIHKYHSVKVDENIAVVLVVLLLVYVQLLQPLIRNAHDHLIAIKHYLTSLNYKVII